MVHAAKQRILGASGQVREARYRHWGIENTRGREREMKATEVSGEKQSGFDFVLSPYGAFTLSEWSG